jgi:hypothetical protein
MLQIITAANAHECREIPHEPVTCMVKAYCLECRSPLDEHDRCPKCDPPPLDYSDSWKV